MADSPLIRCSFWKPEPLPPKDAKIAAVELVSLGKLSDVAGKLLDVPHMARLQGPLWTPQSHSVNLVWQVEDGVVLHVHAESGPPKPGEVLTITARNSAPEKTFYRLYVQIFEQFGATVLDEQAHEFLTVREFRSRLK